MANLITENGFELLESQMPKQADSTATAVAALKDDFNALLKKLQDAGLMAKS